MSTSPRIGGRLDAAGEPGESGSSAGRGRIGLSSYTSQRLAELRAKRAELGFADYKATPRSGADDTTSAPACANDAPCGNLAGNADNNRVRRTMSTTAATSVNSSFQDIRNDMSSARGDTEPVRDRHGGAEVRRSETILTTTSPYRALGNSISNLQEEDECVGFANLPEQVHRKAIKRGFEFTIMVVGESGLGKSTLISSLFLNPDLYKGRECLPLQECDGTVDIERRCMEIEEKGVKLRLTIVDTPGFNDSLNAQQCWVTIDDYITEQFEKYFKDESGLNRKNIKDNRVHCCLYFISPYGHGLRQIDVEFMRQLHDKVNIVPVIAKADSLTEVELRKLKAKVLEDIVFHKIHIYEFPDCDPDEDEEFKKQDQELKSKVPFSVIGSNAIVDVNGRKIRGRLYPWGIVEVDNLKHCDFLKLRQMLISTHMQDLKDMTRDIHYENYRARYITEQMKKQQKDRNKLKRDSSPSYDGASDADQLLQQKDDEIRRMQEMLQKMTVQLSISAKNGLGNL